MDAAAFPTRYRPIDLLGEGGTGQVYRVHDSVRGAELALKLVSPGGAAWLRSEFDTLRQIRHENLIHVFDRGQISSGGAFYTMELVEGKPWSTAQKVPQHREMVCRVLSGVLRGLAHLHSHGEVHGDIKPGNVLLGSGCAVKLSDVGMWRPGETRGSASATPGYAPPEVWEGASASVQADLYSVGVMAYEALTGIHPFLGRTVREVVSGQLEGWVTSIASRGVRIPQEMERAIMRALERDPSMRQGSADEFMTELGINDRFGSIIGGRFVGREDVITALRALVGSDRAGTPTLVHVDGVPGIGKTALLEELSHRALSSGARVLHLPPSAGTSLANLAAALEGAQAIPSGRGVEHAGLTSLAGALLEAASPQGTLIWLEPPAAEIPAVDSLLQPLARHLWALSVETGSPSRILIAIARREQRPSLEPFEEGYTLRPFSGGEVYQAIQGTLGRARLEPEVVARIHALTGGNPGMLRIAVQSLIDRRVLDRQNGAWFFREVETVQSIELPRLSDFWRMEWERLNDGAQRALALLTFAARGVDESHDLATPAGIALGRSLPTLEGRGWVKATGHRWQLASESARQCVLELTPHETLGEVARALLAKGRDLLDQEECIDLALGYAPADLRIADGIWAADQAAARGNLRVAASRLRHCIDAADTRGAVPEQQSARVKLAHVLHELGDDAEAMRCLERQQAWNWEDANTDVRVRREHLMAVIARTNGRLDSAKEHLRNAVGLAETREDPSLLLQCHADLAEIDWQHGGEAERHDAIVRVRSILRRTSQTGPLTEEAASLAYHLGAALIRAGSRAEATEVLTSSLDRGCPEYWRMRMANALCSAAYYAGEFELAMKWLDEAWRLAERLGADQFKPRILTNRAGVYYALGRPRDAVDQHDLAARWARRLGSTFEYLSACSGASINLIAQARYEEALRWAKEARATAEQLHDSSEMAKALELEALASFHIGDYEATESLLNDADLVLEGQGFAVVGPRLAWLRARLMQMRGETYAAEEQLKGAEGELLKTKDWEDLPGVQIELEVLRAKREDGQRCLNHIENILGIARENRALLVQVYAALGIADLLVERRLELRGGLDLVTRTLAAAEGAGIREAGWRLGYSVGRLAALAGDPRGAQNRFRRALHVLREVAAGLDADHRKLYLNSPHVRSAIEGLSSVDRRT